MNEERDATLGVALRAPESSNRRDHFIANAADVDGQGSLRRFRDDVTQKATDHDQSLLPRRLVGGR